MFIWYKISSAEEFGPIDSEECPLEITIHLFVFYYQMISVKQETVYYHIPLPLHDSL